MTARVVLALVVTATGLIPPRERLFAARLVEGDIRVESPAVTCNVIINVAVAIARDLNIPLGAEGLAAECVPPREAQRSALRSIRLQGLDRDAAFEALIEADPRFELRDDAGVLTLRPAAIWSDTRNFLQQRIPSFMLQERTLAEGLAAVMTALGPWRFGAGLLSSPTPQWERRLSVGLERATILDALNAMVRAHAEAAWVVTYCGRIADYSHATVNVITFDGRGEGHHPVFLTGTDGRRFDACGTSATR